MKKFSLTIVGLFCLCLMPHTASAAQFLIKAPETALRNEEKIAEVVFDTQGDNINAIAGEIRIPQGIEIAKILDGSSAVTFWVEKPTLNAATKTIVFSGLTPGGMMGQKSLFSFGFKSATSGSYIFTVSNASAFKNDGKGTSVTITNKTARTVVGKEATTTAVTVEDVTSPEEFTPTITNSPDLFDNKPFVSFLTQDKGVGVDHYEYAATFFGAPGEKEWVRAESPFLLPKSPVGKTIYIKAVDKSGNERVVSIAGPYTRLISWGIIIALLILCVLFISKRFFR